MFRNVYSGFSISSLESQGFAHQAVGFLLFTNILHNIFSLKTVTESSRMSKILLNLVSLKVTKMRHKLVWVFGDVWN